MRYRIKYNLLSVNSSDLLEMIKVILLMKNWCEENISGSWEITSDKCDLFLNFAEEQDYLMFVLKWK